MMRERWKYPPVYLMNIMALILGIQLQPQEQVGQEPFGPQMELLGIQPQPQGETNLETCRRCGQCCQWLAFKAIGMSPETTEWLNARGCITDGDYLILEHHCPHLSYNESVATCDIHYKDDYPILCRRYHGHGRFYIPQGCVYFDDESRREQTKLVEDEIARLEQVNQFKKKEAKENMEVTRVEESGKRVRRGKRV